METQRTFGNPRQESSRDRLIGRATARVSRRSAGMTPEAVPRLRGKRSPVVSAGIAALGIALMGLLTAACGNPSGVPPKPHVVVPLAVAHHPYTVIVFHTVKGPLLADGKTDYTLYEFNSTCNAVCLTIWPALTVPAGETPKAGPGVRVMLGTETDADGQTQVTADGFPLYLYSGDHAPGQVNGQAVHSFGGTWQAVRPNGALLPLPVVVVSHRLGAKNTF